VADIVIDLEVTSLTPTSFNALGGDILTIEGSGFPLDTKYVSVALIAEDASQSKCKVQTSTATEITCLIEKLTTDGGD